MIYYIISFLILALCNQSYGMVTGLRGRLPKATSTIQRTAPARTSYARAQEPYSPTVSYIPKGEGTTIPSGKPFTQPVAQISLWNRLLSWFKPSEEPQQTHKPTTFSLAGTPTHIKRSFYTSAPQSKGFFGRLFGTEKPAQSMQEIVKKEPEQKIQEAPISTKTPSEWISVADAYLNGSMSANDFETIIPQYKSVINAKRPQQVTDMYGNTYTVEQSILQTLLDKIADRDLLRGFDPKKPFNLLSLEEFSNRIEKAASNVDMIRIVHTLINNGAVLDQSDSEKLLLHLFYLWRYLEYIARGYNTSRPLDIAMNELLYNIQNIVSKLLGINISNPADARKYDSIKYPLIDKSHRDFKELELKFKELAFKEEIQTYENKLATIPAKNKSEIKRIQKIIDILKSRIENNELDKQYDEKYEKELAPYRKITTIKYKGK